MSGKPCAPEVGYGKNLFQLDCAYKDRQRFLRKANAMPVRVKKVKEVAPGVISGLSASVAAHWIEDGYLTEYRQAA